MGWLYVSTGMLRYTYSVVHADCLNQLLNTARMATALVIDHMYPAGVLKYSIEASITTQSSK